MGTISDKTNENVTKMITRWINEIHASIPSEYTNRFQTTLNYGYNNYPDEYIQTVPLIRYFGLGIKGCYNVDDENGQRPFRAAADELDLYTPIPIRCVPLDEDLITEERNKYRMRVRQSFYGSDYWCYYLKMITPIDTTVQLTRTDPVSHEEQPFELDSSKLHPIPIKPSTSGEQPGTLSEVNATLRVMLEWSGAEVLEAFNVIYQGDLTKAKISEIGIYTGEDRRVTGYDSHNAEFTYTEAIYTQLGMKVCNIGSAIISPSYNGSRTLILGNGNTLLL